MDIDTSGFGPARITELVHADSQESAALRSAAMNAVCGVPVLVMGLPEGMPAPSGMDLLAHAAMSITGLPEDDARTVSLALEALRAAVSAVFDLRASAFPTTSHL